MEGGKERRVRERRERWQGRREENSTEPRGNSEGRTVLLIIGERMQVIRINHRTNLGTSP